MKKIVAFVIIMSIVAFMVPLTLSAIAQAEDIHDEFAVIYREEIVDNVYYLFINEELVDIVDLSVLEAPFGESSFFYYGKEVIP